MLLLLATRHTHTPIPLTNVEMMQFLQNPSVHENGLKVGTYIIGEFGHKIKDKSVTYVLHQQATAYLTTWLCKMCLCVVVVKCC